MKNYKILLKLHTCTPISNNQGDIKRESDGTLNVRSKHNHTHFSHTFILTDMVDCILKTNMGVYNR